MVKEIAPRVVRWLEALADDVEDPTCVPILRNAPAMLEALTRSSVVTLFQRIHLDRHHHHHHHHHQHQHHHHHL